VLFPKEGTPSSSEHARVRTTRHADPQGDNQERVKHEVQRVPESYEPVDAHMTIYVLQDVQLDNHCFGNFIILSFLFVLVQSSAIVPNPALP
jgi:hypothetical protein